MKRTLAGYLRIFACCAGVLLAVILWGSRVLPTAGSVERVQLVIDPGHGGEDGGAVSCTGVPESQINLEISLRLRDLFRLLGYDPTLLRQEDVSIYTTGKTLSEKKVSDPEGAGPAGQRHGKRTASEHPSELFPPEPIFRGPGVLQRRREGTGGSFTSFPYRDPGPQQPSEREIRQGHLSSGKGKLSRRAGGVRFSFQRSRGSKAAQRRSSEKALLLHRRHSHGVLDPEGKH